MSLGPVVGLDAASPDGNIEGLADILFSRYVVAFEVTSALLITAAMGAMVLAHRERLTPKPTQADIAAYKVTGVRRARPAPRVPCPAPGVFARHNAVDTPALLPDGTPSEISVSRTLVARGVIRRAPRDVEALQRDMAEGLDVPVEEDPQ